MADSKVNRYDPSTNTAYNAAYNNVAYNTAAYTTGSSAPMDGPGAPPSCSTVNTAPVASSAPSVVRTHTVTVEIPVTTQIYRQDRPPKPATYIIHNILTLLFCFVIFGIIGIIKGSMVDSLYIRGKYAAAKEASNSARQWYIWGINFGIFVYLCCVVTFLCILVI